MDLLSRGAARARRDLLVAGAFVATTVACGARGPESGISGFAPASESTRGGAQVDDSGTSGTVDTSAHGPSEPDVSTGTADGDTTDHDSDSDSAEGTKTCACGNDGWSYLWVANTAAGTVSKINTRTLVEEGRYRSRPDAVGNPSQTSVSVDGNAVVVANRSTGIQKIWARPELCDPTRNGQPEVQTSSGGGDVRWWEEEDCIAWYAEFPEATTQRPVSWTAGVQDPQTCEYLDQKVWTVTGSSQGSLPGTCNGGGVVVHRLNGDTGEVEDQLAIPPSDFACDWFGPFGSAVDSEGNFWFHNRGPLSAVKVDFETLEYEVFERLDDYGDGLTVDTRGRPWFSAGNLRLDPQQMAWQAARFFGQPGGGITQDYLGRIWTPAEELNSIAWMDPETLALGGVVTLPDVGVVNGLSVDIDGNIWALLRYGSRAYRIDPTRHTIVWYEGLAEPDAFSDMAGGRIHALTCGSERS